jgi:hypothetical protein
MGALTLREPSPPTGKDDTGSAAEDDTGSAADPLLEKS